MSAIESNKAKIARRVVEVLEFFDEDHPQATVMDIVRRFNRPQSSTSELLSSLVGLGLLYKDPYSRSYTPTPRAALLGCSVQSGIVRDGRLAGLIDRLSAQTGLGVAVMGMIGLKVQIFSWRGGKKMLRTSRPDGFAGGLQEVLTDFGSGAIAALHRSATAPRRYHSPDQRRSGSGKEIRLCRNGRANSALPRSWLYQWRCRLWLDC